MDLANEPLSQQGNKYEVVLSFSRDEDIKEYSFASRLYSSLRKARVSVLKDDISIELLRSYIEGSKISIIIFSEHYISSRRCLQELTKIMEFRRAHDQIVLPIFFLVDPSEVRNEESSIKAKFRSLIQRISPTKDEVSRWGTALNEAGGHHGFFVPTSEFSNESEIIQNIVERVGQILDRKGLFATDGPVGASFQVQEVIRMLHHTHQSKDVLSMGIWGMGGIGKTTIARLIFEHIQYEFESTSFLSSVREDWAREGIVYLHKELLSLICEETTDMRIDSFQSVSLKMNVTPQHKKVLLVLDDVNEFKQLDALRGSLRWFCPGSRIIITTRDLHLLEAFGVNFVYRVKLLSDQESLQLFSRKVFKQASPKGEFIELCRRVVSYTEGLPLALEVLGSFFYGRSPLEWESALMKLSTGLPCDIYNILKLSFHSLDDDEKEIFLNIVLFYIGKDMNDVLQKLEGHRCMAPYWVEKLEGQSLVTIDKNNKLRMHNMLQLMGRQIIRESSQNELQDRGHRYEVFLSFRGEDTRTTYTSHLYAALCNAGIIVFKDDVHVHRGSHIKMELLQAIGSSKIAIIIFSREYAGSKWCLEELSIIMELHKSNDQVVLPVFYDVDPSYVRHQTSSFGDALEDLIQRISPPKVQASNWRAALTEAGGIAGFVVLGSRDESENVKAIVEKVCDILDKKELFVADHPVGVDNRVQEVTTMLQNHQSEDVVMLGIWGMGGIGNNHCQIHL